MPWTRRVAEQPYVAGQGPTCCYHLRPAACPFNPCIEGAHLHGAALAERKALAEMTACLVIVMNHRYEANLPRLRRMYSGRFPMLRFLVPFYGGHDPDVIPVFESSHFFEGFIAQASATLLEIPADCYVFCADDMIPSPRLDSENVAEQLAIDRHDAYAQRLEPLTNVPFDWIVATRALDVFSLFNGVEWTRELPPPDEAFALAASRGIRFGRLGLHQYAGFHWRTRWRGGLRMLRRVVTTRIRGDVTGLPYPLVIAYSDFFAIRRARLGDFAHLCGVFAAMGLYVEVAIPTALLLTCPSVVVEKPSGQELAVETTWHGLPLWNDEPAKFAELHGASIASLIADWPDDRLYVHPVKLGQWTDDGDV